MNRIAGVKFMRIQFFETLPARGHWSGAVSIFHESMRRRVGDKPSFISPFPEIAARFSRSRRPVSFLTAGGGLQ
jgi:hypothetical protein